MHAALMASDTQQTSDTVERLRPALLESEARNEAQHKIILEQREEIRELKKQVAFLTKEVERLLAGHKGRPLSDEGQLSLFGEAEQEDEASDSSEDPALAHANEAPDGETAGDAIKKRCKPARPSRKLNTDALEREKRTHELPEEERICPITGIKLVPVGVKIKEELDFTPAKLKIIEHHQVEYGSSSEVAEERQVETVTAEMPPRPLEGCKVGAGLLAQILMQKYQFHLPLYRQEEVFQEAGLWIPRQTLCDWVLAAAFELGPIRDELMRQIRAGPIMQLDDTPVKCKGPKGSGYFQAYLWTLVNPEVAGVVYQFTSGRSSALIAPLLGSFEGYLVGDGYSGNFAATKDLDGLVLHGGCWAHTLRKFRDATKEASKMAKLYMSDIRELYDLEDEANDQGMSAEQRVDHRQSRARPILARILRRTRGWKDIFSSSGKMGEAIKYLRNQWKTLKCFLLDGRIPLDNNACERAIRPIAIGRKNWLFAGSVRGGEAAAIMYSLVESCRQAQISPWAYLKDVLERLSTHPASEIADLVPARWAELRELSKSA